jgi:hypothetical protein
MLRTKLTEGKPLKQLNSFKRMLLATEIEIKQ